MSYLQDRDRRRKKYKKYAAAFIFLALIFYFREPVGNFFGKIFSSVFSPVARAGKSVGGTFSGFFSGFESRVKLEKENEALQNKLSDAELRNFNYNSLLEENARLKEILGRVHGADFILGNILAKPSQSPYDTLVLDIGQADGIEAGDIVFAFGDIPIGKVSSVFEHTSKVVLFTGSREKTSAILSGSNTYVDIVGRGGGNFEITLPRDMSLSPGQEVTLPGAMPYVVATLVTTINDPRDAYQKALLKSPVNIQELKFVQVKK